MKKGIYYMPMFLALVGNVIFNFYMGDWHNLAGWFIGLFFLCEVYYLRFIK